MTGCSLTGGMAGPGWAGLAHVGTFLWLEHTGNLPRENGLEGLTGPGNITDLITTLDKPGAPTPEISSFNITDALQHLRWERERERGFSLRFSR